MTDTQGALPFRADDWTPPKRRKPRGLAEGTAANPNPKRYGGRYMVGAGRRRDGDSERRSGRDPRPPRGVHASGARGAQSMGSAPPPTHVRRLRGSLRAATGSLKATAFDVLKGRTS